MRAAVYHGPDDVRVEERDVPAIGPNEALLKVESTGVCGTDLRILHGGHSAFPPGTVRVPGHEIVGEIAEVGEEVKGIDIGHRVFVAPNMGCGHCRQCVSGNNNRCADYDAFGITLDGAFAEYMRIPAAAILQGNLISIDEDMDAGAAAIIEPFACVVRGQNAVDIRPADVVLVIGDGPVGMMHTMLARLHGAGRIIVSGHHDERLAYAVDAGADVVVNSRNEDLAAVVDAESSGRGADAIMIAAPAHRAQEESLELAAIGGRINFFGGLPKDRPTITFDSNLVHYKELIVTGTTASSTQDCRQAIEIINSGRIDLATLVSDRFPLREADRAFEAAEDRSSMKVVIEP